MEFWMDLFVLVVTVHTKTFGLHFGKELPTEREFSNFVDRYAVVMKTDFSNYVPSGFESSEAVLLAL